MTNFNSQYEKAFPISDTGVMMLLAASTALAWTVPGTANQIYRAAFSVASSVDVWVNNNGTATVPTSNTATATYNQWRINPDDNVRYVKGGDVLSFISTGTPQIGVELLQLPS